LTYGVTMKFIDIMLIHDEIVYVADCGLFHVYNN